MRKRAAVWELESDKARAVMNSDVYGACGARMSLLPTSARPCAGLLLTLGIGGLGLLVRLGFRLGRLRLSLGGLHVGQALLRRLGGRGVRIATDYLLERLTRLGQMIQLVLTV